mmetsp:Transcript_13988/g.39220  ORF Transcript_13988/g.39220 Transcript_13988/m.39220 type:complete len:312 (-) Transcript_13988:728-1663(-)
MFPVIANNFEKLHTPTFHIVYFELVTGMGGFLKGLSFLYLSDLDLPAKFRIVPVQKDVLRLRMKCEGHEGILCQILTADEGLDGLCNDLNLVVVHCRDFRQSYRRIFLHMGSTCRSRDDRDRVLDEPCQYDLGGRNLFVGSILRRQKAIFAHGFCEIVGNRQQVVGRKRGQFGLIQDTFYQIVGNHVNILFVAKINQQGIVQEGPGVCFHQMRHYICEAHQFFKFPSMKVGHPDTSNCIGVVGDEVFQCLPTILPRFLWLQVGRWSCLFYFFGEGPFFTVAIHPRDFVVTPWPVQQEVNLEVNIGVIHCLF